MTIILLGNVGLTIGMTKAEAKYKDEQIKRANNGRTPVDQNGKQLQSNLSLFMHYDTNKDGVINKNEYEQYREDKNNELEKKLKNTEQDNRSMFNKFKKDTNSTFQAL